MVVPCQLLLRPPLAPPHPLSPSLPFLPTWKSPTAFPLSWRHRIILTEVNFTLNYCPPKPYSWYLWVIIRNKHISYCYSDAAVRRIMTQFFNTYRIINQTSKVYAYRISRFDVCMTMDSFWQSRMQNDVNYYITRLLDFRIKRYYQLRFRLYLDKN